MGDTPIEVSREEVYLLLEILLEAEEANNAAGTFAHSVEIRDLIERLETRLLG